MNEDDRRKERDKITVGQIRARQMSLLQKQINELASILIDEGYHCIGKAESLLKGPITETLTRIQNVDALASTEVLFPNT